MRASIDVPFQVTEDTPRDTTQAVREALAEEVDLTGLELIEIVAIEPARSPVKAFADVRTVGVGRTDLTVTLSGSTYDVQELVRRYEEGIR